MRAAGTLLAAVLPKWVIASTPLRKIVVVDGWVLADTDVS